MLDLPKASETSLETMKKVKKKIKKSKKMNLNKDVNSKTEEFLAQIENLTDGLCYMSETDARILPFTGQKAAAVTATEVLSQTKSAPNAAIEERDFSEFFGRLSDNQGWFGEEEKATALKFADLKSLLEKNLKDLKVFKIGKIQIDIYAVGLDTQSILIGIQTKAVET